MLLYFQDLILRHPDDVGGLIKPQGGLITNVAVIPDFFLHNLVRSVSDDFAAFIVKSGIKKPKASIDQSMSTLGVNVLEED